MSLLDLFGDTANIRTNKLAANALQSGQTKGFNYGVGQLQGGAAQGVGTLEDYTGQGADALRAGNKLQIGAYQQGIAPWQQIFGMDQPAAETYWGALGIGNPEDVAAARGRFSASPGYDYTLGQGLEGLSRIGASTGQLGNANMDAMKFAHNLSDQDYQQWINNLAPSLTGMQNAAQGIQQGYNQIGDAQGTQGRNLADLFSKTGTSIANIQTGLGSDLANLGESYYGNTGQIRANQLNANQAARTAADQNTLSALFGLGSLGVNAFTGGLGSGFGSLFGQPTGTGAFDSMMQGSGFMDNAGNIY